MRRQTRLLQCNLKVGEGQARTYPVVAANVRSKYSAQALGELTRRQDPEQAEQQKPCAHAPQKHPR